MSEEMPTPEWLLSMADDIEASDGLATLAKRDQNVQKLKPEYYGDMIISTPLKRSDVAWALRRAAASIRKS